MFQIKRIFASCYLSRFCSNLAPTASKKEDELFKKIELEFRGHDKKVIYSYSQFLKVSLN